MKLQNVKEKALSKFRWFFSPIVSVEPSLHCRVSLVIALAENLHVLRRLVRLGHLDALAAPGTHRNHKTDTKIIETGATYAEQRFLLGVSVLANLIWRAESHTGRTLFLAQGIGLF